MNHTHPGGMVRTEVCLFSEEAALLFLCIIACFSLFVKDYPKIFPRFFHPAEISRTIPVFPLRLTGKEPVHYPMYYGRFSCAHVRFSLFYLQKSIDFLLFSWYNHLDIPISVRKVRNRYDSKISCL